MDDQPKITDPCPSCGSKSLFIGAGGWLTCAVIECKAPGVTLTVENLKRDVAQYRDWWQKERDKLAAIHYAMHGRMP